MACVQRLWYKGHRVLLEEKKEERLFQLFHAPVVMIEVAMMKEALQGFQ